ncbi:MAG: DUF3098 domain-containing protein [Chitinophagaceae bacterium]|nr:MAG: DUF3098 domain-containing protein [Chitinophagaceae bacterium]
MQKTTNKKVSTANTPLFGKENYVWMAAGLAVLALGFFLMAGGKSSDPNVFKADEVYSPIRITVAPLLIIAGFVIEIVAIMKKPRTTV